MCVSQGRRKFWKSGGASSGHNLSLLVEIGLTDLPKSWGAVASPALPGTTGLCQGCRSAVVAMASPYFGRSINPISTRAADYAQKSYSSLSPPPLLGPHIFRPSYGPVCSVSVTAYWLGDSRGVHPPPAIQIIVAGAQRAKFAQKVHKPPLRVNVIHFELNWFNAFIWVSWSPSDPKKLKFNVRSIQIQKIHSRRICLVW